MIRVKKSMNYVVENDIFALQLSLRMLQEKTAAIHTYEFLILSGPETVQISSVSILAWSQFRTWRQKMGRS